MARFSLIPKEVQYFALFRQMTSHIYDAASKLAEMLAGKPDDFQSHLKSIKAIEHQCDELTHSISKKLNTSFITPFDREDIYLLSGALDDIVDLIDDAARAVVMYNVRETTDTRAGRRRDSAHGRPAPRGRLQSGAPGRHRAASSRYTAWRTRATTLPRHRRPLPGRPDASANSWKEIYDSSKRRRPLRAAANTSRPSSQDA